MSRREELVLLAGKQCCGWSREPQGQRPLLLTTHSKVGATGEFPLAIFFHMAAVEAPVALVYIGDDQLTSEPLTITHKHWGDGVVGVVQKTVPPRDIRFVAIVLAGEAGLIPQVHCH